MKKNLPIPMAFCCLLILLPAALAQEAGTATGTATERVFNGTRKIGEIAQPWKIRALPLASFPEIPVGLRTQMEARHCMVPQSYEAHRPENLVHGSFFVLDKTDWAALCLADGTVSLLVLRNGSDAVVELMHVAVADSVGPTGKPLEPFGFYLAVDAVPPRRVRQFAHKNTSELDAIELSVVDGNSVIHQWNGSAWTEFPGVQL